MKSCLVWGKTTSKNYGRFFYVASGQLLLRTVRCVDDNLSLLWN